MGGQQMGGMIPPQGYGGGPNNMGGGPNMGMQMGDAPATWADATLLHRLTGYRPQTDIHEGIARFVAWFRDYHGK